MNKKNNILKNIFIVVILFTLAFSILENPSSSVGLDNLAYITAIGIDVGDNDTYKISFQVSTIQSSSSDSSSGGSSGESSSGGSGDGSIKSTSFSVNTVECNSIDSGISLMNTYVDKSVDLSHCQIVVISEDLAKKGVYSIIDSIVNKIEIRPDCNIILSRIPDDEFSDSDKPSLQELLPYYYEATTNTENTSGYTENITLTDFFYAIKSESAEPFSALGTVRNPNKKTNDTIDNSSSIDNSAKSVTSNNDKPVIELLGLAVFKNDKLVGTLDGTDTICYLILSNKLENATITVPSPIDDSKVIDLNITLNNKPKISVYIDNTSPFVDIDLKINAKLLSLNGNNSKLTEDLTKEIEYSASKYLTNEIYNYLNKTAKDYNSDITNLRQIFFQKF